MLKKVVIIGPESTGKSTLCAQLANHFNTTWVREYAREYLLTNGTGYTFKDLADIAKGQVALEKEGIRKLIEHESTHQGDITTGHSPAAEKIQVLFIDTNMDVLKVWCEFVFDKCHHWILNQIVERDYELYLLCDIDLPWVKDELREYPDLAEREKLYHHYKDIVINQAVPWANIRGNYEERLEQAIREVSKIIY